MVPVAMSCTAMIETASSGGGHAGRGGRGDDTLLGGAGADELDGGTGNDLVDGDTGDDLIEGGTGDDEVLGDSGNDTMIGMIGSDDFDRIYVAGGTGNFIDAGKGSDSDDDIIDYGETTI